MIPLSLLPLSRLQTRPSLSAARVFSAYAAAVAKHKSPPIIQAGGVVAPTAVAYTLPAEAYISESVHKQEQKNIFGSSWTYLDHISNLPKPGSFSTAKIGTEELLLVRDKKGVVRAFYNVCTHRAHRLVPPGTSGTRPVVLCPNHAWSFKLDGRLHKARKAGGQPEFDPAEFSLKEVKLEIFNGIIFGNLDTDAAPLFESLGDTELGDRISANILQMQDMKLEAVVEKQVGSNWKAMVDNYLECYHCDTAHKDFIDLVDMSKYSTTVAHKSVYNYSPCKPDNTAYSFSPDAAIKAFHAYWIWPNTVVYCSPGDPNMSVLQFIPLTAETSLRRASRFFSTPDTETRSQEEIEAQRVARDAAVSYLNTVLLEEDTGICESIQHGLNSTGYDQGRFVIDPDDGWATERSVAQFHGLVHHAMMTDEQ